MLRDNISEMTFEIASYVFSEMDLNAPQKSIARKSNDKYHFKGLLEPSFLLMFHGEQNKWMEMGSATPSPHPPSSP